MPTFVYKYGLRPPIIEGEHAREQILLAHRYKNNLVRIERERRDGSREAEKIAGDVGALLAEKERAQAALDAALLEVKGERASTRSRSETAAQRERVRAARAALKEARSRWSEARKMIREDPRIIEQREALWRVRAERTREIRAENGLHWGTGALVDQALDAASKMPLYAFGEPADPGFRRWKGEGSVGVQVHQKGRSKTGLTVAEVMTGDGDAGSWFFIERAEPPPGALGDSRRSEKRVYARAHVRLGTREDGSPLMVCWPMVMHRPLPPAAIVKRVSVSLRRIGPREEWSCEVTLVAEREKDVAEPRLRRGTVAVDVGWLAVEGGLRVATWVDDRGDSRELVLRGRELEGLSKPDEIRSVRDRNFNAALGDLVAAFRRGGMPEELRGLTVRRGEKPPTEKQAVAHLATWRSPARLASLCRRWRELDPGGESPAYRALESWRYHDFHLWSWEESQRRSAIRRRQDIYRNFAAGLARAYERVVVGDTDYAELSRRRPGSERVVVDGAALNRKNAAPGALRETIRQAVISRGGEYRSLPSKGLATTCPRCGSADPAQRDLARHQLVCLDRCAGYNPDLDEAACLNLLRAAGVDAVEVDRIIERGRAAGARIRKEGNHDGDEGRRDGDAVRGVAEDGAAAEGRVGRGRGRLPEARLGRRRGRGDVEVVG